MGPFVTEHNALTAALKKVYGTPTPNAAVELPEAS